MFTIGPATSGSDISSVKCSICRLKVTPHRLTSRITRHTSHVTRHTPPASRNTSHICQVMGAAVMCSNCGHAGHPQHILTWFTGDLCLVTYFRSFFTHAAPSSLSLMLLMLLPPPPPSYRPLPLPPVAVGHSVCPAMGCRCTCLGLRQQLHHHQQQHPVECT